MAGPNLETVQRQHHPELIVDETRNLTVRISLPDARMKVERFKRVACRQPLPVDLHVMVAAAQHLRPTHVVLRRINEKARHILLGQKSEDKGDAVVSAFLQLIGNIPTPRVRKIGIIVMNPVIVGDGGRFPLFEQLDRRNEKFHLGNLIRIARFVLIFKNIVLNLIAVNGYIEG